MADFGSCPLSDRHSSASRNGTHLDQRNQTLRKGNFDANRSPRGFAGSSVSSRRDGRRYGLSLFVIRLGSVFGQADLKTTTSPELGQSFHPFLRRNPAF